MTIEEMGGLNYESVLDTIYNVTESELDSFYQHVLPSFIKKLLEEENEQNIEYIKGIIDTALTKDTGLYSFYQFVLGNAKVIEKLPPVQIKDIIDNAIQSGTEFELASFYYDVLPIFIDKLLEENDEQNLEYINRIIKSAIENGKALNAFYKFVLDNTKVIDKLLPAQIKEITLKAIEIGTDLNIFSMYVLSNNEVIDKLLPAQIKEITLKAIYKGEMLMNFYLFFLKKAIEKLPLKQIQEITLEVIERGEVLDSFYEHVLPRFIEKFPGIFNVVYIKGIIYSAIKRDTNLASFYEHVLPSFIEKLPRDQIKEITLEAIKSGTDLDSFSRLVLSLLKNKLTSDQIKEITLEAIKSGTDLDSFSRLVLHIFIEKLSRDQIKEIILKAIQSVTDLASFYRHILPSFIEKFPKIFDVVYIKGIIDHALNQTTGLGTFYQHVLPSFIEKLLEENDTEYIKEFIKYFPSLRRLGNFPTEVTPLNLHQAVLPFVDFIEEEGVGKFDFVFACDRGARPIGFALHILYGKLYGRGFPTRDGKLHFARVSKSNPLEVTHKILEGLKAYMDKCPVTEKGKNLRILFIDDWVSEGTTMQIVREFFKNQGGYDVEFAVLSCRSIFDVPDFSCTTNRVNVDWHNKEEILGVKYEDQFKGASIKRVEARKYRKTIISAINSFVQELNYLLEFISDCKNEDELSSFYEHVLPSFIDKLPIKKIREIIDSAITNGKGLDSFYKHVLPKVIDKLPIEK